MTPGRPNRWASWLAAALLGLAGHSAVAAEPEPVAASAPTPTPTPTPAPAPSGDARRGRDLFSGATRFHNGGAPCAACHAIGGNGQAFAATLGPELSTSFADMAPEAVDGLLSDLPFPTMTPVYAGHAIEPAERADLGAFFAAATGKPPPGDGPIYAWAAAVAVACLAILGLVSRRRPGSLREQLVARAQRAHGGSR